MTDAALPPAAVALTPAKTGASRIMPRFVPYPFMAALYPVLGLAVANGGELIRPSDLITPALISLCVAGGLWLLSRITGSDPHRRAVVTFIGVMVFSSYGYWVELLWQIPFVGALARDEIGPFVAALFFGATAWSARRSRRSYPSLSRWLNVGIAVLVGWTVLLFGWQKMRPAPRIGFTAPVMQAGREAALAARSSKPHLFLIILDKYTGSRSLAANYQYDNTPFERQLEARGFVVPHRAQANYVHTFLALASMLNWEYLDAVTDSLGPEERRRGPVYSLVEDNRTWRTVKPLGYRFVFLPTAYEATAQNRFADLQLPEPRRLTHEFEVVWLRTTLLLPVLERVCAKGICAGGRLPYVSESAESLDWKFAQLRTLAQSAQPLFVFAHLTVPHEPFVYDAECRHLRPYWPRRDDGPEAHLVKAAYVQQLQCVNRRVREFVDAVAQDASRPAIVVLQSDHGHGRLGRVKPAFENAPRENVAELLDIFAAYRLPAAPPGVVHDSIGPVNAMRAIMRQYYGIDLEPLEEASYWSSTKQPYRLTRVR